jgi:alkanesulfonate monooxygenase SsuD/methylene tetrahydromethanopterin reductase-like flavin-dependent oxidoreductase (luciferase family)
MTLRQFTKWIAQSGFIVAGIPESIAERIALWSQQRAVDGFVIMPPWPGVADVFFTQVVPLLQERGI